MYQKSTTSANEYRDHTYFNINNINTWHFNNNITDNNGGFRFPNNQYGTTAIFQSGFIWGGKIDGQIRVGGSAYLTGLQPGKIKPDGTAEDLFTEINRIWRVRPDYLTADLSKEYNSGEGSIEEIRAEYQYCWNNWPVDRGAPFQDMNGNNTWEPEFDIPGVPYASQTIWYVANDLNSNLTTQMYGSEPMGIELQVTIWGFADQTALNNTTFRKFTVINKNIDQKDFTDLYFSLWSDPDLGNANDDNVGCDPALNLAYCYNGDSYDEGGYNDSPPAIGYKLLQGPIVYSADGNDQGFYNGMWQPNTLNLQMNAFYFFLNGIPEYTDPDQGNYTGTIQFYNFLRGLKRDGQSFIDPNTSQPTVYPFSGDPFLGMGWINGQSFPPGDRRLGLPVGPINLFNGESQDIVYAVIMAEPDPTFSNPSVIAFNKANQQSVQNQMSGEPYLQVINKLKIDAATIQNFYYNKIILSLEGPSLIKDFAMTQILSHFKALTPGETVTSSEWYFIKPTGSNATLSNFSDASVSLQTDIEGYYTVYQKVNTSLGNEVTAEIRLFATSNKPPVPSFTFTPAEVTWGDYVYCDGRETDDLDNDPLSFEWRANAIESFTYDDNHLFKFIPYSAGDQDIGLTVKDKFYIENINHTVKVNPLMDNIKKDYSITFPEWQGGRRATFIKDNFMFVVPDGANKLYIYEILPTTLNKVKELDIPGVTGIANYLNNKLYLWMDAEDNYGYYFTAAGHLSIYNVTGDWVLTPLIEKYNINGDVLSIQNFGDDYVLMNEYSNVFKIYKVDLFTDPTAPQILGTYDLPNDKIRTRVTVVGDKYWLGLRTNDNTHSINIYNLSDFTLAKTIQLGQDNSISWTISKVRPDILIVNRRYNCTLYSIDNNLNINMLDQITINPPFELQDQGMWQNFGNNYSGYFLTPELFAINKFGGTQYFDYTPSSSLKLDYAKFFSNQTLPYYSDGFLNITPANFVNEFVRYSFIEPIPPKVNVTFRVDLNPLKAIGMFDPESDYFAVSGTFWNWGIYEMMRDYDDDGIYEFTSLMPGNKTYKYSFLLERNGVPDGIWEKNPLREFTVGTSDIELPIVYFENMTPAESGNWFQAIKYYNDTDWHQQYIFFGEFASATNGEDRQFGESYFPFSYNEDVRDIRFTSQGLSEGTINDFKSISPERNIWNIKINSTPDKYPIILEWNKDAFPPGNFILQDNTARFINLNMRYFDRAEIYNKDISELKIVYDKGLITRLIVSDLSGICTGIDFGLLENATDGIDLTIGENPLPPPPPDGILDARFKIPETTDYTLSDFRAKNVKTAKWTFDFKPGASGYPMKVKWNIADLPSGDIFISSIDKSIDIDMRTQDSVLINNTNITQLSIELTNQICSVVPLQAGWNIISIPVIALDMTHATLFPNATSQGWKYSNGYISESNYSNGFGYWIRYPNAADIDICGSNVNKTAIDVAAGWNLIGVYEKNVMVNNLTTTPADNLSSNFFGYANGYSIPTELKSGFGYWIRAKQDGVINLNYAPPKANVIYATGFEINKEWGKVSISDSKNNSSVLYLSTEEVGSQFDLPPIPPDGVFDVRWGSNRFVESIKSNELILNSAHFPIRLKSENIDLLLKEKSSGKVIGTLLKTGEPVTINELLFNQLIIEPLEMPLSYQLLQNYPNPFNPATIIKYGIPERSNVKVVIYNSLGEIMETLINEINEPGFYEVKWNAASYASGVYFYRITTDHFTDIKKMILIK
jgi:hypothetical protein